MRKRSRKRLANWCLAALGVATLGAVGFVVVDGSLAAKPDPVSPQVQHYYDEHVANAKATLPAKKSLKFAAVGDSITEANSPDFVGGKVGDGSWVYYASASGAQFVGGWADGGAPTPLMVQNTSKVTADAVVILAGTNDLGRRPLAESQANVATIAANIGAQRVIVSAVPPFNKAPQLAVEYNASMKSYAESKGWTWVDPMGGVRAGDVYADGMTSDGTHPTPAAARLIGEAINRALLPR